MPKKRKQAESQPNSFDVEWMPELGLVKIAFMVFHPEDDTRRESSTHPPLWLTASSADVLVEALVDALPGDYVDELEERDGASEH